MLRKQVLCIIRGVPGSGKSTLAQALVKAGLFNVFFEADMYFIRDGKYKYERELTGDAHRWCRNKVSNALGQGLNVVVSNTSTREHDADVYKQIACEYGAIVQEIIIPYPPFKSIHGVSQDTIDMMQERLLQCMKSF